MYRPTFCSPRQSLSLCLVPAYLLLLAFANCGSPSASGTDGQPILADTQMDVQTGDDRGTGPDVQRDVQPFDAIPDPFPEATNDVGDGGTNDPGTDAKLDTGTVSPEDALADPGSDLACVVDTDHDGVPDCEDGCPLDPLKTAPGACGCGVPDTDSDGDTVPDCLDRCPGGDDLADRDNDGLPDACDACDDDGGTCPWPAETTAQAANMTSIGGSIFNNDFAKDLSGAHWDPVESRLWLCRNNGPDGSMIFAVVKDDKGWAIEERGGKKGRWEDFGDLESLTLASPEEPFILYLVTEGPARIRKVDLSAYGSKAVFIRDWVLAPTYMPSDGSEGLTFVPDALLVREGFVDQDGNPYVSTGGMGGLFLVGHQVGGYVYAMDLGPDDGSIKLVGKYRTARTETAGLDFDHDLGLLFILHGDDFNEVEVTRLSSSIIDGERKLDTVHSYKGPEGTLIGGSNFEGIALTPAVDCPSNRSFFLTIDGGKTNSLYRFDKFPCW